MVAIVKHSLQKFYKNLRPFLH